MTYHAYFQATGNTGYPDPESARIEIYSAERAHELIDLLKRAGVKCGAVQVLNPEEVSRPKDEIEIANKLLRMVL